MLQGTYDFDDVVKIDCNNAYAQMNVYVHEMAHWGLAKNTLFGILNFLVKQISEEPGMKKLYGIVKVLRDASERTNECYAMCNELIFVESQRPDLYDSFYDELKRGQYYSKYQFQELEFLMNIKMDISKKSNLVDRIFTLAMNIDVSKYIEAFCWSSDKHLLHFFLSNGIDCYPDFRLKKILQALKELIISEKGVDILDQDIVEHSNIIVDEWSTNNVISFLENLMEQFKQNSISIGLLERNIENLLRNEIQLGYNQRKGDDFERQFNEAIIPDCLTQKYISQALDNNMELIKQKNISVTTIYDYGEDILLELTDTLQGRVYSVVSNKECLTSNQWSNECGIIFYFDDIEIAKNYWKKVFKRRIFFQLKNRYSDFKNYIEPYCTGSKNIFLYRLNHGAFFIFVAGKDDDVFFTCQSMINLDYVQEDIVTGFYKRVDFRDSDCIDGVFCRSADEWRVFYNIILYASEIKHGKGSQQEFLDNIMLY